jgi:hypothetical protein
LTFASSSLTSVSKDIESATTRNYETGMSDVPSCVRQNDNNACQRFDSALNQLLSICQQYKYQLACDNAWSLSEYNASISASNVNP